MKVNSILRRLAICAAVFLQLALAACATSRSSDPPRVRVQLTAAPDVNPDGSSRPSPVVVKVFGLRTDTEFTAAEFFPLYEHAKETLSSSIIVEQEYVLQPGEKREQLVLFPSDVRYIGVIAAYRDIRSARWRVAARAPRRTWTDMFGRDSLTITARRSAVALAVKD
jgi:type VI secretion system protein VasD